jgi:hypothetical protein
MSINFNVNVGSPFANWGFGPLGVGAQAGGNPLQDLMVGLQVTQDMYSRNPGSLNPQQAAQHAFMRDQAAALGLPMGGVDPRQMQEMMSLLVGMMLFSQLLSQMNNGQGMNMGGGPGGPGGVTGPGGNLGVGNTQAVGNPMGSGGPAVDRLFKAITGQESGGQNLVNPHSGALGIGQVMPSNVRAWSKEALGYEISPQQFKNDVNLQRKIVHFKLNQYYQEGLSKTGSEQEAVRYAAAKWYSGNGNNRNNYRAQSYAGHAYPSIGAYADSVYRKFLAA